MSVLVITFSVSFVWISRKSPVCMPRQRARPTWTIVRMMLDDDWRLAMRAQLDPMDIQRVEGSRIVISWKREGVDITPARVITHVF